uniref:Uncharacterized protein n=1 Tax=Anguilla anguilla TaxID=7936 RepID=A0A0E9TAK1_ANGAN
MFYFLHCMLNLIKRFLDFL